MPKQKDLYAILIFGIVLRGIITTLSLSADVEARVYLSVLAKLSMYLSIALGCAYLLKSKRVLLRSVFVAVPCAKEVWIGTAIGFGLFGFTLGENSIEVLFLSQFDVSYAYQLWHFQTSAAPNAPVFTLAMIASVIIGSVIAPYVEELFFRGLLLPTIALRFGFLPGALLSSIIFTFLHFSGFYYLSVLAFAVIQCYLYKSTRSLGACIIAHGIYNLLAFTFENFVDFHFVRRPDRLSHFNDWAPELWMLVLSLVIFLLVRTYNRRTDWSGTVEYPS